MELNHLRYFREAALAENISQAAKALYLTQPALSVTIKKLEAELGYPLFAREGNKVRLTEAGRCFLSYVNSIFSLLEEGMEKARKLADQAGSALRVASGFGMVQRITDDYLAQAPEPQIEVSCCAVDEVIDRLLHGQADAGVILGHAWDIRLEERVIMTTPFYICVNPEHPLAGRETLRMADLEGQLLFCSNISKTYEAATRLLQSAGVNCNVLMLDEHKVLFSAAEKGLGAVFCIPMMNAPSGSGGAKFHFIPIVDASESGQLVLLRPKGRYCTGPLEEYLHYLEQWFARNEELLRADIARRGAG